MIKDSFTNEFFHLRCAATHFKKHFLHPIEHADSVVIGFKRDQQIVHRRVNTPRLYLRDLPHGMEKGILMAGTAVERLKTDQQWSKVRLEGWLSHRYLMEP